LRKKNQKHNFISKSANMEGVLSTSNVSDNLMKMSLNARLIAVLEIVAIVAQSVNVTFFYTR
jgi:hypothetical protein